jgi:hypothetical protein
MRHLTIALVSGALACGGEQLEVGSDANDVNHGQGGAGASSGTGGGGTGANGGGVSNTEPVPSFPAPDACAGGDMLPLVGTWEGYIEGSSGLEPTDKFRVVFAGASEAGGVCGTVTYGEGAVPPPATDPDTGYPSLDTGYPRYGFGGAPGSWGPMPGVPFTILDGTVEARRVRFNTAVTELWKDWCALQTPVASSTQCIRMDGFATTTPGACTTSDDDGQEIPIDCDKRMLCGAGVCVCNDHGCAAAVTPTVSFDLLLDGDTADGSMGEGVRTRMFRTTE